MKYKPFPPGLLEIQIHHTTAYNLCTVNTHYFQIYYINLLIFYDNFLLSLKSEFPASRFPPGGFSAISHYSPSVCSAAGEERFFTIQSLKQGGFTYTLHRPGLKDWFYASLIRYSRKVPSIRTGSGYIFGKMPPENEITLTGFISFVMAKKKKLRTSDFISCVRKNYGITLKKEKIAPFLKDHETGSGSPTQPPRPAGRNDKKIEYDQPGLL